MYAVIESGGKQHRVIEGEVLKLEKLEVATGETLSFDKVLLVGSGSEVKVGSPLCCGQQCLRRGSEARSARQDPRHQVSSTQALQA